MAYTEFFCVSGGSNMNGGHINANTEPSTTPVYSATNGAWSTVTNKFTPTSGNPSLTVKVGDFAHVFADGSTTPTYIGRVTAVSATDITISSTLKAGTAPTTAATGISINVGGAWAGPSGSVAFPFAFATATLQDGSNNRPRINFKNNQTYSITAAITHNVAGPIKWQGYTTTAGDGGQATIDGGTLGASYVLLSISNVAQNYIEDFIFQNNGATGSASLFATTVGGNSFATYRRLVFAHSRGHGMDLSGGGGAACRVIECEAYDCNQSNTANLAGFASTAGATVFVRCISHDNTGGANAHGWVSRGAVLYHCISESNTGAGLKCTSNGAIEILVNCDFYNNTLDGYLVASGGGVTSVYAENCNFVKNGGYGLNLVDPSIGFYQLINNGFGAGTQVNTNGQTNITTGTDVAEVIGSVTYANDVTPWVDPANGDFRINLAAAKAAGRGAFTQTAASYTGALAYLDIGSNQHQDTGGGSTGFFIQ
ncbi:hypothetical protein JJE66_33750 [Bradyrhizobium diazoefficiens]|uniref:hypothetical protein n=1 Tax=Bradyrhizobium diazoefficiens TaxID=1355477 RepID=UPI00190A2D0A|nr:hypothetical protein [Bradyrhizobium diazoefficiens]MBK3666173.1 hypothetical protein [Bradyrhizobium diazoefficiens]